MNAQTRGRWWLYALLTVLLLAVIAPFIWMVLGSFKTQGELLQSPPTWWPRTATLDNYTQLFSRLNFKQYFRPDRHLGVGKQRAAVGEEDAHHRDNR